ncbi:MAG: hypothetical protein JWQ68_984 [Cryobacterium sp.]|jgi:hypothetical protein|nr:hypothetical protein [Cryobacterium sp.]
MSAARSSAAQRAPVAPPKSGPRLGHATVGAFPSRTDSALDGDSAVRVLIADALNRRTAIHSPLTGSQRNVIEGLRLSRYMRGYASRMYRRGISIVTSVPLPIIVCQSIVPLSSPWIRVRTI